MDDKANAPLEHSIIAEECICLAIRIERSTRNCKKAFLEDCEWLWDGNFTPDSPATLENYSRMALELQLLKQEKKNEQ